MSEQRVLIVGGGPAGIAAASSAVEKGLDVTLIDENAELGGQLRWRLSSFSDPRSGLEEQTGPALGQALSAQIQNSPTTLHTNSIAWALFGDKRIGVSSDDHSFILHPSQVILATGSTDLVRPFTGWTLPGVMTARAAQILVHIHRVLPGTRAAVIGNGSDATEVEECLNMAGIPVVFRSADTAGVEVVGEKEVSAVRTGNASEQVDLVVIALGKRPDPELAFHVQVQHQYCELARAHLPMRNEHLETSLDGLYLVGYAAGAQSIEEAIMEGHLAGLVVSHAPADELVKARDALVETRSRERQEAVHALDPIEVSS